MAHQDNRSKSGVPTYSSKLLFGRFREYFQGARALKTYANQNLPKPVYDYMFRDKTPNFGSETSERELAKKDKFEEGKITLFDYLVDQTEGAVLRQVWRRPETQAI